LEDLRIHYPVANGKDDQYAAIISRIYLGKPLVDGETTFVLDYWDKKKMKGKERKRY
jgi:hypothetical protein